MNFSFLASLLLLGFLSAPFPSESLSLGKLSSTAAKSSSTALGMGLFGGDADGLKNMFQPKQPAANGPTTVLEIPVKNIKPRPLRFFLQIYIVGQQNSKDSQSWLPKEEGSSDLQVYYQDGTGMCNIVLGDDKIVMERHGQRPSLQYMLQESLMLHGVLDELAQVAFEVDDVEDSQRLLMLDEKVIDEARSKLPARQE